MPRPVYRAGDAAARRIRLFLGRMVHPEQDLQLDPYQLALIRQFRTSLTPRELQCMSLYYLDQLCMEDISRSLGVHPSTISRNVHRGEKKMMGLLRLAEKISPIRSW